MLINAYFTRTGRFWIQAPKLKTERGSLLHGQSTWTFTTDTHRIALPGNAMHGFAPMSSVTALSPTPRTGA